MTSPTISALTVGTAGKKLPDPEVEPTISVPQAGRIFGLSRPASYEAAKRGELPTIRIGRRLFVPVGKLREMLGLDVMAGTR